MRCAPGGYMALIDGRICKYCHQPFAKHLINSECPTQIDPQQQTKFEAIVLNDVTEKITINKLICGNCKQGKPILDHSLSIFFTPVKYYYCPVCGTVYREI